MAADIISEQYEASQAVIAARIDDIFAAAAAQDLDRLSSFHLQGPKFSKFDDEPPLDRQDIATAMRREAEQFTRVSGFDVDVQDLKVDVFGEVAVATAVPVGRYAGEDFRIRMTLVFVHTGGDWLLAHEHVSDVGLSA